MRPSGNWVMSKRYITWRERREREREREREIGDDLSQEK